MPSRYLSVLLLALVALGPAPSFQQPAQRKPDATPRVDQYGDPLPPGVLARCGSSRLRMADFIYRLEFTSDGNGLACVGSEGIVVWDVGTGKRLQQFPLPEEASVRHLAFAPDGKTLNVVVITKTVEYLTLEIANGNTVRRTHIMVAPNDCAATVSPDRKQVAVAVLKDHTLRLHDTATGEELSRFPVQGGKPINLAYSPDGGTLALSASDDRLRLYQPSTGNLVAELHQPGARFCNCQFSPDGRRLSSRADQKFPPREELQPVWIVWDVASRRSLWQTTDVYAHSLAAAPFSPDGRHVACNLPRRSFTVADAATGQVVRRLAHDVEVTRFAYSPDGKTLAVCLGQDILLWNTITWQLRPASCDPLQAFSRLRFSPDGQRLLSTGNRAVAWEPRTGKEVRRFPKVPVQIFRLDVSPDEKLLASRSRPDTITFWDAASGQARHDWTEPDDQVRGLAFTADGKRLVASFQSCHLAVYDVASKKVLHRLTGPRANFFTLSGDDRWLAAVDLKTDEVWRWDLSTGRELPRLSLPHGYFVDAVAFSPDGNSLAIAGTPGNEAQIDRYILQVWDIGRERLHFTSYNPGWRILELAFSPDGRMLASADAGGMVHLWEVVRGGERCRWTGHQGRVWSVTFSPDGRLVASTSGEAPIYIREVRNRDAKPLAAAELDQAWLDLQSSDASIAFKAIQRLAATPKLTVPFLQARLQPVPPVNEAQVKQLLTQLDNPQFAVREKAAGELQQMADRMLPLLRQVLQGRLSPEARRRLEEIVRQGETISPEALRSLRAVEALEWIGTPEVLPILDRLASGAPDAELTREAKASAGRLRATKGMP